ncbi:hypothetical protein B0H17DRAFT_1196983 [Mycena rosella]|uniref:Carboxylesterase type B domain-containing protein n=1 Tax=Mycena rosella TaxID=1033263 RepID=A0AAD7G1J9_MYCRO|nr:hypothetical protein B0H17DRAFT_1213227 [Mycena rosella]KAJ7698415.1 hypothetical protein B0H17DRAFT_1196983 [Mycena rosella]
MFHLIGDAGANTNLFHQAMGDNPSLSFLPHYTDAFVEDLFPHPIKQRPVEALRNGNFACVPVLFGSNTNEGAHWSASLPNPAANTSSPNATETTTAITEFYPLSDSNGSISLQGQQMYGEMRYICSAVMITGAADDFGLKAYQYRWDNPGPTLSSDHGAELNAFFDGTEVFDSADQAEIVAMRSYFTSLS